MDSDDDCFDAFNNSQEMDECSDFPDEIPEKKNSSFQSLTSADIAKWMNEHVDDVKSIVQVSS